MTEQNEPDIIDVQYFDIHFSFPLTRDEAELIVKQPKHKITKGLKRYVMGILKKGCEKMLTGDINEEEQSE